jgi:EAL domain-containing protein (putative c-di-GMP-specific phosphodiesterase class I)
VEEKRQYEMLKEYGADEIQGYYFSKPLPADKAREYLISWPTADPEF